MAPTRGFRRALIAVAAIIDAARFLYVNDLLPNRCRSGPSDVRPCDVLDHPFHYGYDNLPPEDYRIRLAPAPRYRPGHPYYKYSSMGGSSCGIKERSGLDAVLSEWSDIYGASPPADSRLLAHYMTTPPEAPPVKLRRKAGYDAGSAFKRWALRRGKGE